MQIDALHIIGYLGALGSLMFGANQLRIILVNQAAKDVSVLDYVIRVVYSTCLGIYAAGKADIPFAIVGIGGALLAVAVTVAAWVVKSRNKDRERQSGDDEKRDAESRDQDAAAFRRSNGTESATARTSDRSESSTQIN